MLKVLSLSVLILAASTADLHAQQAEPPARDTSLAPRSLPADATLVTSSLSGMSYVIATQPQRAGVKRTSAASRSATDSGDSATITTVLASLSPAQLGVLEKLNRVNGSRLRRLPLVVIPSDWTDDELAYSPFPAAYAWAADKAKTIVVDQSAQAFGAYEHGQLVRWGPVSTGEKGATPSGVFNLSWRSRGHHSSVDPAWYLEWYFNFIPSRGIAFHQYALPGRAASHGCVRLLQRDAQWLYHWGEASTRGNPGTTVVVLNCPDPAKPWQRSEFLQNGIWLPDSPEMRFSSCVGVSGRTATTTVRTLR